MNCTPASVGGVGAAGGHGRLQVAVRVVAAQAVRVRDREAPMAGRQPRILDVVAGDAEARHRGLEHPGVRGAVGIVAAGAVSGRDRSVGALRLHDLADVVVATEAELPLGLLEERGLVGRVSGVAVVASPFPDRRVGQGGVGIEARERMAAPAGLVDPSCEEVLAAGRVRVVAGGAILLRKGGMLGLVAGPDCGHIVVTGEADLAGGRRRAPLAVAGVAAPLRERRMAISVQQVLLLGLVPLMAAETLHARGILVEMVLSESLVLLVVAGEAEAGNVGPEELRVLASVGLVTDEAVLLSGRVHGCGPVGLGDLRVAGSADRGGGRGQKVRPAGAMGVMAGGALPLGHRGVHVGLRRGHVHVTSEADLVRRRLEQRGLVAPVWDMAVQARFLRHRGVHARLPGFPATSEWHVRQRSPAALLSSFGSFE